MFGGDELPKIEAVKFQVAPDLNNGTTDKHKPHHLMILIAQTRSFIRGLLLQNPSPPPPPPPRIPAELVLSP